MDSKVWLAALFSALAFYVVALAKSTSSTAMYAALTLVFVAVSIMPMFFVARQ